LKELDCLTHWGIALRQPDAIYYRIRGDDVKISTFCNLSGLLELYRGVVKKESVESSSIPELKWLGDDTFELTIQGNEKELNKTCSREELQKKLEEFLAETFISLDKTSSSEQKEKAFNSSEKYDEGPALEDIYERITGGQNT